MYIFFIVIENKGALQFSRRAIIGDKVFPSFYIRKKGATIVHGQLLFYDGMQ
jgi:hypothetical protein